MHFTYAEPLGDLKQGDILQRTPDIESVLELVHPHYNSNDENMYFIVLTQSCDLVRGRGDEVCKSRYISLAPVRPLSYLFQRKLSELKESAINAPIPVCGNRSRNALHQLLEKLTNNNESSYFYIHKEPSKGIIDNYCAFLRLSIALRAQEHYEKCLGARVISLNETFQAKLGWLVGQMYSRVGTTDWPVAEQKKFIKENLAEQAFWVEDKQIKKLKVAIDEWSLVNVGVSLDNGSLEQLIKGLKNKKDEVLARVHTVLRSTDKIRELIDKGDLSDRDIEKLLKKLEQDPALSTLLK